MPSFDFSIKQPPTVSEAPTVSKSPGRVWEGATVPLPIKNQVSVANALCGVSRARAIVVTIRNNYLQGYKDLGGVRCGRFLDKKGSDVEDKKGSDVEGIT